MNAHVEVPKSHPGGRADVQGGYQRLRGASRVHCVRGTALHVEITYVRPAPGVIFVSARKAMFALRRRVGKDD